MRGFIIDVQHYIKIFDNCFSVISRINNFFNLLLFNCEDKYFFLRLSNGQIKEEKTENCLIWKKKKKKTRNFGIKQNTDDANTSLDSFQNNCKFICFASTAKPQNYLKLC